MEVINCFSIMGYIKFIFWSRVTEDYSQERRDLDIRKTKLMIFIWKYRPCLLLAVPVSCLYRKQSVNIDKSLLRLFTTLVQREVGHRQNPDRESSIKMHKN